ncbi:hypothetical protein J8273_7505 [Carpediemonas membranifera]|uniref:Uncharacterized protein n=1 Tax=Carpediemonas membranifera TaxID=201153 RepID=A0A8J6AQB5_9EUKA|nr:hypothetical protein J8273_7505 [Carpediemonas membranifera]|eukprot:KAG9391231.1 hypothetical protein J8273_7505 [Carpediemonas membranifera]
MEKQHQDQLQARQKGESMATRQRRSHRHSSPPAHQASPSISDRDQPDEADDKIPHLIVHFKPENTAAAGEASPTHCRRRRRRRVDDDDHQRKHSHRGHKTDPPACTETENHPAPFSAQIFVYSTSYRMKFPSPSNRILLGDPSGMVIHRRCYTPQGELCRPRGTVRTPSRLQQRHSVSTLPATNTQL